MVRVSLLRDVRGHRDVFVDRLEGGLRALLGEGDRFLDLGLDLLAESLDRGVVDPAALLEDGLVDHDGVAELGLFEFLRAAVLLGVGHRVAAEAVGLGLDEGRALAGPGAGGSLAGGLGHQFEVVAVDRDPGHAVGGAAADGEVEEAGVAMEVRAHRHPVVLDDVDDRELPEAGHVEGLVERALVHGAVAEVADADAVLAAILAGEGDACGERDVAADDGVAAEEPLLGVEEVHRAALALGAAGGLAEQLGHGGLDVHAAGDGVAVVTIGRDHVIVLAEDADRTDRHRLLSVVQVAEPADLPAHLVELVGLLLEAADQHHLPQPAHRLISGDDGFGFGRRLRHHDPLLKRSEAGIEPLRGVDDDRRGGGCMQFRDRDETPGAGPR